MREVMCGLTTFKRKFYANVTTLRSAYGMSRPSVVCNGAAPYIQGRTFRQYFLLIRRCENIAEILPTYRGLIPLSRMRVTNHNWSAYGTRAVCSILFEKKIEGVLDDCAS